MLLWGKATGHTLTALWFAFTRASWALLASVKILNILQCTISKSYLSCCIFILLLQSFHPHFLMRWSNNIFCSKRALSLEECRNHNLNIWLLLKIRIVVNSFFLRSAISSAVWVHHRVFCSGLLSFKRRCQIFFGISMRQNQKIFLQALKLWKILGQIPPIYHTGHTLSFLEAFPRAKLK